MNGLECHEKLHEQLLDRSCAIPVHLPCVEEAIGSNLERTIISTSEHIAPFNTVSTVSFLLPQLAITKRYKGPQTSICVLAASLIPLDNADYPRGFLLPGYSSESGRINLFPGRLRKGAPALLPPIENDSLQTEQLRNALPTLAEVFFSNINLRSYADQMSRCMEHMASQWFARTAPVTVHVRPLEEVARDILLGLLQDRNENLYRILFNRSTREMIFQRLMHVYCAWGNRRGSFLFWGVKDHRVQAMTELRDCLRNEDLCVPLKPEEITRALEARLIMPTVFLSLFAVSYLPGLPIAGGPRQFHYYRAMINALNGVLDLCRSDALSTFGYNSVDLTKVRVCSGSAETIHPQGTGLSLMGSVLDSEWISRELMQVPLLPTIEDRYE